MNPFNVISVDRQSTKELIEATVDRKYELDRCCKAINDFRQCVLIHGSRGVGKTHLLMLLKHEFSKDNKLLPVPISISRIGSYNSSEYSDFSVFSKELLLYICIYVWDEIFNHDYLSLRETINDSPNKISLRNEGEKIIQNIYKTLKMTKLTNKLQSLNMVGAEALIKSEKSEQKTIDHEVSELLPLEFREFLKLIVSKVLRPKGIERIIVLLDEANLMPITFQENILNHLIEVLGMNEVNFVFVASTNRITNPILASCFETVIKLGGLPSLNDVKELIDKRRPDIPFTEEAIKRLYDKFDGNVRIILTQCWAAYSWAEEYHYPEVTVDVINRGIAKYESDLAEFEVTGGKDLI